MVRTGRKEAVDLSSEFVLSWGSILMPDLGVVEDSNGIPTVEISTFLTQQTNTEQTP